MPTRCTRVVVGGFLLACWLLLTGLSVAIAGPVVPPNDDFANRSPLAGSTGQVSANTLRATNEVGEPAHASSLAVASVWWTWTPPQDAGEVVIFDTIGSDFDTVLAVYLGNDVANLEPVVDNDDGPDGPSRVSFQFEPGQEYQIAVDGYSGSRGEVILNWASFAGSSNDDFANRTQLTGAAGQVVGQNFGATAEDGEPDHAELPAVASLWWSWTAPDLGDQVAVFDTVGSDFDTVLAVYTGGVLFKLSEITSNDDADFGGASSVTFAAVEGKEYQIAVDGYGGARGGFVLNWGSIPPAPNDAFANRIPIEGVSGEVRGDNFSASGEIGEPDHAGTSASASIWWSWTAPDSGDVAVFDTSGSDFDTVLAVYVGSSLGDLRAVVSNDDSSADVTSLVAFTPSPGEQYHIAVDGYGGSRGAVVLSWRARTRQPNDAFAQATALEGDSGTVLADSFTATSEPGEPDHAGSPAAASLWWSWTAPGGDAGFALFDTVGSDFDTVLAVYTGSSLASLNEVASNDDGDLGATSLVAFGISPGEEYLIAVDGYGGDRGAVTLNWSTAPPLANDNFFDRALLEGSEGQVTATTVGATRERGEPSHGRVLGGSVWWRWIPSEDGFAVFDTNGSLFDTFLAIYRGQLPNLGTVVVADDDGNDFESHVAFHVIAGFEYQIAVSGLENDSGFTTLNWRFHPPCGPPPVPGSPEPRDGSVGVPTAPVLEWSRRGVVARKTIYGDDDRQEIYQLEDPELLRLWDSTVALVRVSDLEDNGDGTFSLPGDRFGDVFGLCPSERFRDQPVPASCSGFLVGEDLVATAGHCLRSRFQCSETAFVFGFRMLDAETPVLTFDASQVYRCQEIVAQRLTEDDGSDWGLHRLDRPVPDHRPLEIRRQGAIALNEPLIVIGHPSGLPAKIADGGRVRVNLLFWPFFEANLDTYRGNSGSVVLNANTRLVEGILVTGDGEDFIEQGDCFVSKVCPENFGNCFGAGVTRIRELRDLIPANPATVLYEVWFGPCGRLDLVAETSETSWTPGALERGREYCWRIDAVDECGSTEGETWSFTTAHTEPIFRRGDANSDGTVDLSDAVSNLAALFLGVGALLCERAADANDDGLIDISDAIATLFFLFVDGTQAPPAPGALSCGADPTADGLSCAVPPPCE